MWERIYSNRNFLCIIRICMWEDIFPKNIFLTKHLNPLKRTPWCFYVAIGGNKLISFFFKPGTISKKNNFI